jgi:glycosyltransferase involved in cell wall biosynthesis
VVLIRVGVLASLRARFGFRMKVNVLELIGSFEQGGSERQAVQLSRNLEGDKNFKVFIGCLERRGALLSEIDWQRPENIPEFRLSSFYDLNFANQIRRCSQYIRANDIKLVHTHDFYTNIFGMLSAYLAGIPCRVASKRETFSKTKVQTMVERNSFRLAHKIVANAEAVKRFLLENGVSEEKTAVIYNGVNISRFESSERSQGELFWRLGLSISQQTQLVTIVANLRSDVKNHSMFLRSAKEVSQTVDSAEFIIAGEGELLGNVRDEANALGINNKVHFVGSIKDVSGLLSASDVCVLSSRSEGFSNAILEYMASGKPVVATRVGGAAEAIIEGETGFVVETGDTSLMSRRITQLLQSPGMARRLGENGRLRVKKQFSLEAQLEKTKELYEELLLKAR